MTAIKAAARRIEKFVFSDQNMEKVRDIIARYPKGRQQSAVMPLLDLAQRQNKGSLSVPAMDCVAEILGMPPIRVYEVATFYTMYYLKPMGRNVVQVCTTTPCWLRGSDDIMSACKKKLQVELGQTTDDGRFTLLEVECLGACVNAPVVQINDDFYEDLNADDITQILDDMSKDKSPKTGSYSGRQCSAPKVVKMKKKDVSAEDKLVKKQSTKEKPKKTVTKKPKSTTKKETNATKRSSKPKK